MLRNSKVLWAGVLAAVATLVGCAEEPAPKKPKTSVPAVAPAPVSPISVTIVPADLTSATADTPITLWVDYGDRAVPAATLAALRKTVRLEELQSGAAVDFDIHEQPSAPAVFPEDSTDPKGSPPTRPPVTQTSNPNRAALIVLPKQPLKDGWYRASFDPKAAGVSGIQAVNPLASDGRHFSRFSPSHAPVVQSISTCAKSGESTAKVVVRFSEPVTATSLGALSLRDAGGTPCGSNLKTDTLVPMIVGTCPSNSASALVLEINPSIKSVDGQSLGVLATSGGAGLIDSAPLTRNIDLSNGIQTEALCKTWVP